MSDVTDDEIAACSDLLEALPEVVVAARLVVPRQFLGKKRDKNHERKLAQRETPQATSQATSEATMHIIPTIPTIPSDSAPGLKLDPKLDPDLAAARCLDSTLAAQGAAIAALQTQVQATSQLVDQLRLDVAREAERRARRMARNKKLAIGGGVAIAATAVGASIFLLLRSPVVPVAP